MEIEEIKGIQEIQGFPDNNIIETSNHTLIIEDIKDRFEPMNIDFEEDEPLDVYERISGFTLYKLYMGNFESNNAENFRLFDKLRAADQGSSLEVHVSSDGGNFYELVEFYNLLKPKFNSITTFLNRGYSAGSMMFLLGDNRIVYEHSDMMCHSYTGVSYGKREDMLNQTLHQDKMITNFFDKMYSPYFTKKEIKKMNKGQDFWMNSQEMLKRGIATGIILDTGEYKTRDEYLGKDKDKK
jgi:ATP-dependent protease ClpP protease subunit